MSNKQKKNYMNYNNRYKNSGNNFNKNYKYNNNYNNYNNYNNKRYNSQKEEQLYSIGNSNNNPIKDQIKSIESQVYFYRTNLFDYYKNYQNSLKICNDSGINYIRKNNLYPSSINNNYKLYNQKELSDVEIYETFGKYLTSNDKNGKTVFYTDIKLYNGKKNIKVENFEYLDIGFPNIGNSCYMNAFLQILLHTPNFLKYLYEYNYKKYDKETLIYNLAFLSKYPYNSDYLKQIQKIMGNIDSKYKAYIPGDSQNFAIDFIDQLISECKNEDSDEDSYKSRNEPISKYKKYLIFCENYNNKKDKIEKLFQFTEIDPNLNFSVFLNIELGFPPNIGNKINLINLLNNKYLDGNNKNIKPKLADLPEILIISFVRGVEGKNVIKINVSFSEELELKNYLDLELTKRIKCSSYQLYAVNERYGANKTQGHYVSFIKVNNKSWHRFSDLYVTECYPLFTSPDVFGLYYIRKDCIPK